MYLNARKVEPETVGSVTAWCGGVQVREIDALDSEKSYVGINVPTANGMVRASEGWWVIKQDDGTFTVGPEPVIEIVVPLE